MLEKVSNKCCGCSACLNKCPKKAINMVADSKGFKYPVIDKTLCIECGLCENVCPILNNEKNQIEEINAYACYNKNENERFNSSSGGIFILLAKEIIKMNGVVFGACLDEKQNVQHIYIEKQKELYKLMKSKYVQSTIGNTYKNAEEFLRQGKIVLFTGTPCQIDGLYSYLGKEYENLFTQDIVCHGVPSPKVWDEYKKYRYEKDGKLPQTIDFRNKDNGWKKYQLKFNYENESYSNNSNSDLFLQSFLRNTILRDSCYQCNFKDKYRKSDITLADFWGIDKIHKELNDDKGISLVLVNSKKGNDLFSKIKPQIMCQKTDLTQAIKSNSAMTKSAKKDKKRELFFKNLELINFEILVKKYTTKPSVLLRILKKIKRIIRKCLKRKN